MTSSAHARSLLPASFAPARLTARQLLALGGGLGCAAWSYAGAYPQFDDGKLRLVLALSSFFFGAFVSGWSVRSSTRGGAFGRGVGTAAALGVASSILPTFILCGPGGSNVGVGLFFGVMCGVPTGLLYGVPLGILGAAAHRGVRAESQDGTDRVAKAVGLWLAPMALVAMALTLVVDFRRPTDDPPGPLAALPALFAATVLLAAVALVVRALVRLRARRHFVARVAAGEEPMYRVRALTELPATDVLAVGAGSRVIEWVPDGALPSAYRAMAHGIPVAAIDD